MAGNNVVSKWDLLGMEELGVGVSGGVGAHLYLIGVDVSIGAVVTTGCRVCITATITVALGPGLGVHAGLGPTVQASSSTLDGPSIMAGSGGWIAAGGGASFSGDGGFTPSPAGTQFVAGAAGGKGEVGIGLAWQTLRVSASCTGCGFSMLGDMWDCITNFTSKWKPAPLP
jgi:hypothetical protein